MLPLDSIDIKTSREERIRDAITKITKSYVIMGICCPVFGLILLVLMAFFRDDIASFTAGRDQFVLLNEFFSLDLWKQWAIIIGINALGILEVLYVLAIKRSVDSQNEKRLRIWFWYELLTSIVLGITIIAILVTLINFSWMSGLTGLVYGVVLAIAYIYEIYVLNILYKFIQLISTQGDNYNYFEKDNVKLQL